MGYCLDCPDSKGEQILVSGRCQSHYKLHRLKENQERDKKRSERNGIDLKLEDNSGKELWDWYERQVRRLKDECEECGCKTKMRKREHWAVAHIFSKGLFPSIATNDDNWMELCSGCHTKFDDNLEKASKMKVFKTAIERFKKFEHLITENHKYLDLFKHYANESSFLSDSNEKRIS